MPLFHLLLRLMVKSFMCGYDAVRETANQTCWMDSGCSWTDDGDEQTDGEHAHYG
jgi:hypothetical protein